MAYIRDVTVELLAARRIPTKIALNRDVNVFFGANGSGKTSLLRILHSALSGRSKDLRRIGFASADVTIDDAYVMTQQMQRPYRGEIKRTTQTGASQDRLALSPDLGIADSERIREKKVWHTLPDLLADQPIDLRHTYLPISRLYVNDERRFYRARYEDNPDGILSETVLDKLFAEMVNLLWLRYTRNTSLEIQAAQSRGISEILAHFLAPDYEVPQPFETNISEAYRRLQAFLERQTRAHSASMSQEAFEERIKNEPRMQLVLTDIEHMEIAVEKIKKPRNEFDRVLSEMISSEKKIQLADRDIHAYSSDSAEIQLEDLSSGEKQLLRICIDVLLADGQPVLIDEPEISMHIDWQRRLIPALRALAPESQLIVATHSPEIMASIRGDQIFEL